MNNTTHKNMKPFLFRKIAPKLETPSLTILLPFLSFFFFIIVRTSISTIRTIKCSEHRTLSDWTIPQSHVIISPIVLFFADLHTVALIKFHSLESIRTEKSRMKSL